MTGDLRSSEIFSGSTASMPAVGWWEGIIAVRCDGGTDVCARRQSQRGPMLLEGRYRREGVLWEKDR